MFDIGFTELLFVGLVALLVLGPERLPVAARMAGLWVGRFKRGFTNIKEEVEREIGADEIRRQLHNEDILAKERKMLGETVEQTRASIKQSSQALEDTALSVRLTTPEPATPATASVAEPTESASAEPAASKLASSVEPSSSPEQSKHEST